jgi:hypothetical protein
VTVPLVESTAEENDPARPRRRARGIGDLVAVVVLLGLVPVVHDIDSMLTAPYWLDEGWVAVSLRFPFTDLPETTGPTPIAWTALLWLVPDEGSLRVVPLAFHFLTVAAAYLFARSLDRPVRTASVVAGLCCAAAVLLLPAQQMRHDLKQYTADAALALGLLALAAWTEGGWSRRRLGVMAAAVPLAMLLSHAAAIVGVCVFGGLFVTVAARRRWRRLVEVAVAAAACGVGIVAVYLAFSARGMNTAMRNYWLPKMPGLAELPGYLATQLDDLSPYVGGWPLLVLSGAGVAVVVRHGRPAVALAVVLLPVVAVVLGVARLYPLLELRTSHFLLVVAAALAGLGVYGLAEALARTVGARAPRVPRAAVGVALAGVMVLGYAYANRQWLRFDGADPDVRVRTPMAAEDIRSAVRYIEAHRRPGDIVVVSGKVRYGFAFYWDHGPLQRVPSANALGWTITLPTQPDVIFAGQDEAGIRRSLDQALTLAATAGPTARVWLVRSHVVEGEVYAWTKVLADYRVDLVTGGVEPVATVVRRPA